MKEKIDEKISILLPSFNSHKTILKSINSALNQKYKNFELLVSDNASNDGTIKILKKIKNKNIKIFYQKKNIGPEKNWEFLLNKSNSRYVIFLGSDDYFYSKNSLIDLHQKIYKTQNVCSAGSFIRFYDRKEEKEKIIIKNLSNKLDLLKKCLKGKYNFLWYGLWRKDVILKMQKSFVKLVSSNQFQRRLSLDRAAVFFTLIDNNLGLAVIKDVFYVKRQKITPPNSSFRLFLNIFFEFFYSFRLLQVSESKISFIKILYIISSFWNNLAQYIYKNIKNYIIKLLK